jgi:nicotinamide riboside kinase
VLTIARQQVAAEASALAETTDLLVCDTDLLVIQVWWQERFGELPEELIALLAARSERAYLLVQPDLPWAEDPLRENPLDRDRLFAVYQALLDADRMPHRVIGGSGEARLEAAVEGAQALLPRLLQSAQ